MILFSNIGTLNPIFRKSNLNLYIKRYISYLCDFVDNIADFLFQGYYYYYYYGIEFNKRLSSFYICLASQIKSSSLYI